MKPKALISIDLDFFCREKIEWDWGHGEPRDEDDSNTFSSSMVWLTRYMRYELYRILDPQVYADFTPGSTVNWLKDGGFVVTPDLQIGAGWSHKDAFDFFKDKEAKTIYNFDAHHDAGYHPVDKLDCGNWLCFLKKERPKLEIIHAVPKWREEDSMENGPEIAIEAIRAKDLVLQEETVIEAVYIAQSPGWIPPHFDKYLYKVVDRFLQASGKVQIDFDKGILKRKCITRAAAHKIWKESQDNFKKLTIQNLAMGGGVA